MLPASSSEIGATGLQNSNSATHVVSASHQFYCTVLVRPFVTHAPPHVLETSTVATAAIWTWSTSASFSHAVASTRLKACSGSAYGIHLRSPGFNLNLNCIMHSEPFRCSIRVSYPGCRSPRSGRFSVLFTLQGGASERIIYTPFNHRAGMPLPSR